MDSHPAGTRWKLSKGQYTAPQKQSFLWAWAFFALLLLIWQTVQWYQIVLLNAEAYRFPQDKINPIAWQSDLNNGFSGNISTQLRALWQTETENLWAIQVYDASHELSLNYPDDTTQTWQSLLFIPKLSGHWQEIELQNQEGMLIGHLRYAVRHDYARDPTVRGIRTQNAQALIIAWLLLSLFFGFLIKQRRLSNAIRRHSHNVEDDVLNTASHGSIELHPLNSKQKNHKPPRWQSNLNDNYARTGRILDQFEVGFVAMNAEGHVQFLSHVAEKILRLKTTEIQGKLLREMVDFYHDDSGEICLSTADRCLRGDGVLLQDQLAIRIRDMKTHREKYLQLDAVAVLQLDMAQRKQNVFMMLREAGKYSPDKQHLRDEIEQYKQLFELLPVAVLWCDSKANIIDTNPALCRLTGFKKELLCEQTMVSILHSDSWRKPHLELARAAEERLPVHAVLKTIDEQNINVQVHVSRAPMVGGFSLTIQTLSTPTIAAPITIPLAHETMQDLFTHLLETSEEEIYILDAKKMRCLEVSAKAVTQQRRSMDHLIDLHLQEISPSLRIAIQQHQKTSNVAQESTLFGEYLFVRADQTQYRVKARVLFVPNPERPLFILYAHSLDSMAHSSEKNHFYHLPH